MADFPTPPYGAPAGEEKPLGPAGKQGAKTYFTDPWMRWLNQLQTAMQALAKFSIKADPSGSVTVAGSYPNYTIGGGGGGGGGGGITSLTGDVTTSSGSSGVTAATLASILTGPSIGTFSYATITTDAKGRITAVAGNAAPTSTGGVNLQTGTTYTYLATDYTKLVSHTNAAAIAATLPQASVVGFIAPFHFVVENRGLGTLTITPTVSTINAAATLVLLPNTAALIYSDGTNYHAVVVDLAKVLVNSQSGVAYTFAVGDRGTLVSQSNAASIADTLPQATGVFGLGWFVYVQNTGVGTVTITPTTSTIDGAANLTIATGQGCLIASDGANYFTVRGIGGGAGGLANWTEALTTAAPNSIVNVASFAVKSTIGTVNVDAALVPKGTGAVLAQIPDSGVGGGNKRGANAVDLQTSRTASAMVAASPYGFIGGGLNNTINFGASVGASFLGGGRGNSINSNGTTQVLVGGDGNTLDPTGSRCFIGGGGSNFMTGACTYSQITCGNSCSIQPFNYSSANYASAGGSFCSAQADAAWVYGSQCTATGLGSHVAGTYAIDRGVSGAEIFSSIRRATAGDNQKFNLVPRCSTGDAVTLTFLTSDSGVQSPNNQILLPTSSVLGARGQVVGRNILNGQMVRFEFSAALKNVAGTVSVVGTPVVTQTAADVSMTGTTLAISADNVNKCLAIGVTGVATASAVHWSCEVTGIQGA